MIVDEISEGECRKDLGGSRMGRNGIGSAQC